MSPVERTFPVSMSNPFSTRFIQPGALPYFFPGSESVAQLAARLQPGGGCYGIVGEHGTGKSTLLVGLYEQLKEQLKEEIAALGKMPREDMPQGGLHVVWLRASDQPSRTLLRASKLWRRHDRILLDGFEQLPAILRWFVRRRIGGLQGVCAATSHREHRGFKLLWRTDMSPDIERRVLDALLQGHAPEWNRRLLASDAWRKSRTERQGNLRESLFDMYDWWQACQGKPEQEG